MKGTSAARKFFANYFSNVLKCYFLLATFLLLQCQLLLAQLPKAGEGFTEATKVVSGYFGKGVILMYGIGAVVGIVGAIKVYNKWNAGDQDTGKVAAAWFGSCIFLVVVATVLKGFFGVTE